MKFVKKFLKSEKGITMIETAVVLPIIIALLWGSFQTGFFLYTKVKLSEAKRAGLKQMEIDGGLNANVVSTIQREFNGSSIDISSLAISGTGGPRQYGEDLYLRLDLDYQFNLLQPFLGPVLFSTTITVDDWIKSENIIR